jgi:hypothetical protein
MKLSRLRSGARAAAASRHKAFLSTLATIRLARADRRLYRNMFPVRPFNPSPVIYHRGEEYEPQLSNLFNLLPPVSSLKVSFSIFITPSGIFFRTSTPYHALTVPLRAAGAFSVFARTIDPRVENVLGGERFCSDPHG